MKDVEYIRYIAHLLSESEETEDFSSFPDVSQYSGQQIDLVNESAVKYPLRSTNGRSPKLAYAYFHIFTDLEYPLDEGNCIVRYYLGQDPNYHTFEDNQLDHNRELRHAILSLAVTYNLLDRCNLNWTVDRNDRVYSNDPNKMISILLGSEPKHGSINQFYIDYAPYILGFIGKYMETGLWYTTAIPVDDKLRRQFDEQLPSILERLNSNYDLYDQIDISPNMARSIFLGRAEQG